MYLKSSALPYYWLWTLHHVFHLLDFRPIRIYYLVVVNDSTVEVNFRNISAGKYAIAIYHDQNLDNKLNTNQIGIPTEGFGFSGNYSLFKKPKFKDCSFEINNDTTIVINMHYLWN